MQPVEYQSTSPRKCIQCEWSSTGATADAVGDAFQTAGRCRPSASAGTRSACRNRHNVVFRSRHSVTSTRSVCQNSSRVVTLGTTPCLNRKKNYRRPPSTLFVFFFGFLSFFRVCIFLCTRVPYVDNNKIHVCRPMIKLSIEN